MKTLKLQNRYFIFFGYTTYIEIIKCDKLLIEMRKYWGNILRERI